MNLEIVQKVYVRGSRIQELVIGGDERASLRPPRGIDTVRDSSADAATGGTKRGQTARTQNKPRLP